ncbi:MAG: hypothetical protein SGPRY_004204 [Prymnesium sp.]
MDFDERSRRLDELKRKKEGNARQKEAIMRALAEDKAEREHRAQQKKILRDESHSTLAIRTENGALRHKFPSGATLLDVREWLLEEQRKVATAVGDKLALSRSAAEGRRGKEGEGSGAERRGREVGEGKEGRGGHGLLVVESIPDVDCLE